MAKTSIKDFLYDSYNYHQRTIMHTINIQKFLTMHPKLRSHFRKNCWCCQKKLYNKTHARTHTHKHALFHKRTPIHRHRHRHKRSNHPTNSLKHDNVPPQLECGQLSSGHANTERMARRRGMRGASISRFSIRSVACTNIRAPRIDRTRVVEHYQVANRKHAALLGK